MAFCASIICCTSSSSFSISSSGDRVGFQSRNSRGERFEKTPSSSTATTKNAMSPPKTAVNTSTGWEVRDTAAVATERTIVGVVGAGTMGAGIAQLAAQAGCRTLLVDVDPAAVREALVRLDALVERGKLDTADRARVEPAGDIAALAPCKVVIEAVAERLEVKRQVFAALEDHVAGDAVLATNTSSLSVTAIAAALRRPERAVGMHFFNPPPLMRLVEVVAGDATSPAALDRAARLGEAMGRRVIRAADGPGFLVNRCNRPFALEALRVVSERLATPEQVDRICRLGGGFRMGPFELMDLVGLDVGQAVAESFYAQSYGEPRWRPSPLAARLVAAGRLGRKSGRGWYVYPDGPPPDPEPPDPGGGAGGLVVISGDSAVAWALRDAAARAGWAVADPAEAAGEVPDLILDCGATEEDPPLQGAHQAILCDTAPLAALDPAGSAVGFHVVAPLGQLVELTAQPSTAPAAVAAAEAFFATLGMVAARVGDAPGLVLGRIVAQLVNEAAFALGEGVGTAEDIDAGMVLGLNHPRGPLEWADALGPPAVLGILAALEDEYREDRYRPAPALLRAVRADEPLGDPGA
jgi:3-hydroxybutyryl-CoA dehydrogenase